MIRVMLLISLGSIGSLKILPATAQNSLEWSPPNAISSNTEYAFDPTLTVDLSGTVHAFWSGRRIDHESEPTVILYSRYQVNQWVPPVDILASPDGQSAQFPRSIVDHIGRIHVFWSSPDQGPFGPLYHSWTSISTVDTARNWQIPAKIADGTYQSDVAIDPQGRLHLVYASVSDNRGICHLLSENNGDTWEPPTCLPRFSSLRDEEAEVRPRLAIDSLGQIHVVWVLDDYSPDSKLRYSGRAIYYARSTDSGVSWSDITIVDEVDGRGKYTEEQNGLQPEWPRIIIDLKDQIHIVWVGNPDMLRYHQWSNDGGVTWSSRQVAIAKPFYNGWMGLAVDNDNVLHFISPASEGIWYSQWNGFNWSPPTLVDSVGDPHYADLVVTLGNELHAVWQDNGGIFTNGAMGQIRHSMMLTAAKADEPQPLPTPLPHIQSTPTLSPTSVINQEVLDPTTAPRPMLNSVEPATAPANPVSPLLIGLLPPVILIGLIVLLRLNKLR